MDRFSTPRLTATRLSRQDLPHLVALHLDPEVSRFIGGVRTPASTEAYLERSLRHWDDHGFGLWSLRAADGAFVGRAGLRWIEVDGAAELEIAYTLAARYWRLGLASEIVTALVGIWKERRPGTSLVGVVTKGHAASERVLLKAGFAFERETTFDGEPCGIFRLTR
jgi:RimJ/RimL family protein N-acetyltransferase